jgi:transcriptional regulator with XRE-family HTH domain
LKELRKTENLTGTAFLEKAKVFVTRQALSRWENGEDLPALQSLIKIANTFQVPIQDFFSVSLLSNDNLGSHEFYTLKPFVPNSPTS